MCETKRVLVSQSINLLAGAGFCIYQVHTVKNVGHRSEIKRLSSCVKEYKDYCSNGECYYLVDEDIGLTVRGGVEDNFVKKYTWCD